MFTGAGVSAESGIPAFRSPGGVWSRYDPGYFTIQKFLSSHETRENIWKISVEAGLLTEVQPNPTHYATTELYRLGKLDCATTQNINSRYQKTGVPEDKVSELRGNMQWVVCTGCCRRFPLPEVLQKVKEGMEVPNCPDCRSILKPDVVFFGKYYHRRH